MTADAKTYFDLLYSNSIWRQSSIPTSILIELLLSGGILYECTHTSFSLVTSAIRRDIVTLTKYLETWLRLQIAKSASITYLSFTLMPW